MSTSGLDTASWFVPASTGSTGVSPWISITSAPAFLDLRTASSMYLTGMCVSSTPGIASIPHASAFLQSRATESIIHSKFEKDAWSVIAIALWSSFAALRMSSIGRSSPSLNVVCVWKSHLLALISFVVQQHHEVVEQIARLIDDLLPLPVLRRDDDL